MGIPGICHPYPGTTAAEAVAVWVISRWLSSVAWTPSARVELVVSVCMSLIHRSNTWYPSGVGISILLSPHAVPALGVGHFQTTVHSAAHIVRVRLVVSIQMSPAAPGLASGVGRFQTTLPHSAAHSIRVEQVIYRQLSTAPHSVRMPCPSSITDDSLRLMLLSAQLSDVVLRPRAAPSGSGRGREAVPR